MVIRWFPPVEEADEHGVLALGGDLDSESLLLAYRSGIFPWPLDDHTLAWFAPPRRSILYQRSLRVGRSLRKARRSSGFTFSLNRSFRAVIENCRSTPRPGQRGTWITNDIVEAYTRFHTEGFAHSVECWEGEVLVGGIYGVRIGGFFAGESMFHHRPNASKLSLWFLMDTLHASGISWMDTQVLNPFLEQLGAVEVPREQFMVALSSAVLCSPGTLAPASDWKNFLAL